MKINDGCALECKKSIGWTPVALRYLRLPKAVLKALNRGETVQHEGQTLRRYDWAERQSLIRALNMKL